MKLTLTAGVILVKPIKEGAAPAGAKDKHPATPPVKPHASTGTARPQAQRGEVLDANENRTTLACSVGDTVLYDGEDGIEVSGYAEECCLLLKEGDVLAVVKA